jgi:flagellar biosynthesis protein FlhB
MAGTLAGLVTAIMETTILCPLERVKVWLMTSETLTGYKSFWKLMAFKSLFRGFWPVLTKQILSWVSFLGTQEYLKELMYEHTGKNPSKDYLSNQELAVVALCVCLVNTLFVMPADYLKTHFQKYNMELTKQMALREFIVLVYRKNGIRGFYRGGSVKVIHYNINSMLTVPMMEVMLRMIRD